MDRTKTALRARKRVWRITEAAPMGEFIDSDAPRVEAPELEKADVYYGGWVASSFDLLHGTDVNEDPDTVPNELYDELFTHRRGAARDPHTE